jgi:uncharacterized membrane protein
MASTAPLAQAGLLDRLLPNRLLAVISAALAVAALMALWRGRADWGQVPVLVWLHLATVLAATVLTPVMLLRRKGTRRHRQLGYVWVTAMAGTALVSLFFNTGSRSPGQLGVLTGDISPIHALSVFVLAMVPLIVVRARQHRVRAHESAVRGMVIGALLVAGWFTFAFDRVLGTWLFAAG